MATAIVVVLVVLAVLVLANTAVVIVIWSRQDSKQARVELLDRRLTVLEERTAGIGEVRTKLDAMNANVAAINERSESTLSMVRQLQVFLMEKGE